MKKLLALVLALVMTLSLAVVGSNAAFKDADKVNETYAEAVDVLAGMKVFQGYTDGSFQPEGSITRAEVAAIVYRLYTGDVTDKQASLYATYNKFNDMDGAKWAAGYIGYCANAGLIKGYDAKTFGPADKVTGYQALAMILRAVGYDKNDEFTGAQWQLRVASTAQQLGILKNVKGVDLNAAATRELVAELLFRTAAEVSMVTYTPALGYTNLNALINGQKNDTLGYKNFGLTKTSDSVDKWGRPFYKWTNGKTVTYATVKATPVVSYTKAVAECDVAHDAGLTADKSYTLWVNGDQQTTKYVVNLTDTTTKLGAQGRLVEVYDDSIVMIDTFLAKVTSVADAAYDAAGHLKTPATINLTVYDGTADKSLTLTNGETNYGYAKGDYVLLNAKTQAANINGITVSNTSTTSGAVINAAATKYGEVVAKAESFTGAQSIIYWNSKQHNVGGTVYDDAYKFILDQAGNTTENHTWLLDQYGNLIGAVDIAAAYSYGVINSIWWAGNAADGTGVATAIVTYMDGTTGTVTLSKITVDNAAVGSAYDAKVGVPTYSVNTGDIMTVTGTETAPLSFFVTTNAATNFAYNDVTPAQGSTATQKNGIIANHLFQFTTKADGTVIAVEVSGNGTAATGTTAKANFRSLTTTVSKNTPVNNGMVINNETVFLIRSGLGTAASPFTYKTVTGVSNIDKYISGEVDYVLSNGVAQYVYITADTTTARSSSLFYYNGGAVEYTNGAWTIDGSLDGEPGKLVVNDIAGTGAVAGNTEWAKVAMIMGNGSHKLYQVALADGELAGVANDIVALSNTASVSDMTVNGVVYKLPAAYTGYNARVLVVSGAAGDSYVAGNYNDKSAGDNYNFLYVEGLTKKVGVDFTEDMSGKDVILVWNADASNPESRVMLQAYVVEKSTAVTGARPITGWTLTAPTINNTTYANAAVATVSNPVYGTVAGVNAGATAVLQVSTSWARWDVATRDWVVMGAYEPFVTGTSYQYTTTVSIQSTTNGDCVITAPATNSNVLVCS